MLQDVINRSSEVGFHKEKKKRAVEGGRIIFRPTVYQWNIHVFEEPFQNKTRRSK